MNLLTKEFPSSSFNVSCITLVVTSVKVGWLVLSHSQALSPDSGGDLGRDSGTSTHTALPPPSQEQLSEEPFEECLTLQPFGE